jgi:hypothetical protein
VIPLAPAVEGARRDIEVDRVSAGVALATPPLWVIER